MNNSLHWLMEPSPYRALAELRKTGALKVILPEVDALYGVEQNAEHHPEICTGIHTEMCLDVAERLNASFAARFAVLTHDLGKALTPKLELPKHIDHELRGIEPVKSVCTRLKVDAYSTKLALLVCEYHLHAHRAFEMRSKSMLRLLSDTGLESDFGLLEDFLVACEADKRGRLGKTEKEYPNGPYMRQAASSLRGLAMAPGTEILGRETQELHRKRLEAVRAAGLPFRKKIEDAKARQAVC
jgi:tRNA nucleotidyltransferase (CCA-adding enzyme)